MNEQDHVVVAGGTGLIGRHLSKRLSESGCKVTILSRGRDRPEDRGVSIANWDPAARGPWEQCLSGATAVVNLCGASIAGPRWTAARKAALRYSRIMPTRTLSSAVAECESPPKHFIQASGVGYVGTGEAETDEGSPPGNDFLAQLAVEWEGALEGLRIPSTTLRFGVVFAADGGALPPMALPFRLFAGGPIGAGTQWLSWVHIDDAVGAALHALTHELEGVVNVTAPNPLRNVEFARSLGAVLDRPTFMRMPRFALELALGEQATLACDGQRALPRRLLDTGFAFRFPSMDAALRDLLR